MSGVDCCPFILRFSKSMLRPNPKKIKGGVPRTSGQAGISIHSAAENMRSGFHFYSQYEYNRGLPLFCRMSMKPGSSSKSLRYPLLRHTGITFKAGLSLTDFIFSVTDTGSIDRLVSRVSSTSDRAVLASYSHISDISSYMPDDKQIFSPRFMQYVGDMQQDTPIITNVFGRSDADIVESFLISELGAAHIERHSFIPGAVKAVIPDIKSKLDRIFTHSLVRSVSLDTELTLGQTYVRHEDILTESVMPRDFGKSYPKAAVADSGLAENSLLKEWEIDTLIMTQDRDQKHSHGTFVTGRLLKNGEAYGGITFLNIEILPSSGTIPVDELYAKLRKILEQYHNSIKIYNLSVGSDTVACLSSFSEAAYALDSLQYEFDVLFIISAGNYDKLRTPETIFGEDRVACPAESVNSLTVGSAAQIDTNMQIKDSPSLFTRRGPGTGHSIKPDLCAYGGAHEIRMGRVRPVGVYSIGTRNELAEDIGTSHAVPRVAAMAAKLYDRYSHAFRSPDMTRALILHYTHLKNGRQPNIYTGYGVLPDENDIKTTEHSAIYLNSGRVGMGDVVEIPEIPVPPVLFDNDKVTCRVCATLVYKPETDIAFPCHYVCANLELSLGYYKSGEWTSLMTAKDLLTYTDAGATGTETKEIQKWIPVKMYEKMLKNKALPSSLTLRLTPSKRDFYNKRTQISYSMVISFSNESKNVFRAMQSSFNDYNGLLEPASQMWKKC